MRSTLSPPVDAPRSFLDISDDRHRSKLVSNLIEAASKDSPMSLDSWSSQTKQKNANPPPTANSVPVANVWRQLNSLRIMAQYTRLLGEMCSQNPFLQGNPITCVQGLEWLSRFTQPTRQLPEDVRESIERTVNEYRSSSKSTNEEMTLGQAAFDVHRNMACSDRAMTQLLMSYNFPNASFSEHDVDICAWMMAQNAAADGTREQWLHSFSSWRDSGLFYPMVLGSIYMPHIQNWLPSEVHGTPIAIQFARCLTALSQPRVNHLPCLKALDAVWRSDASGASHIIAGTLDRIAVLMGVKSNGLPGCAGSFCLKTALSMFPRSFGDRNCMDESNFRSWMHMRSAVEDTFPPSLLCAPLVRPRRPTWGHQRLTLQVHEDPSTLGCIVCFAERKLSCVLPSEDKVDVAHTYSPSFSKECLAQQTSFRVQDVLWRLGDVSLSSDVASCMMHPRACAELLNGTSMAVDMDPQAALDFMASGLDHSTAALTHVSEEYMEYMRQLNAIVPPVETKTFAHPQAILMWRLDMPSRAIVYLGKGTEVKPDAESQHHLRKVLVNSKVSNACHIGSISRAPLSANDATIRDCLRSFAKTELASHPSNTVLVKAEDENASTMMMGCGKQVAPVTCTTLAESVACFALCPPSKIMTCELGASCSWKDDGIDPRYAERQLASNGTRFRDWVAMHVGKHGTQQSRLASHVIKYDTVHHTYMPWISDNGGDTVWVSVSSSAKPESKTLQGRTLRQAVEGRFFHDLRMLPTQSSQSDAEMPPKVERCNAELYMDGPNRVSVAYAPSGQERLEFIVFEHVLL